MTQISILQNARERTRFIKFAIVGAVGALVDFAVANLLVFVFNADRGITAESHLKIDEVSVAADAGEVDIHVFLSHDEPVQGFLIAGTFDNEVLQIVEITLEGTDASEAELTLKFTDTRLKVIIKDNGIGFRLPKWPGEQTSLGKLGLTGMKERAMLLGGTLRIESKPGRGTTVTAEIRV